MSVSASTSIASPPPFSPNQSPTSTTASTPSTSVAGNRHRPRPSFTIGYSQPPLLRASFSGTSSHGVSEGLDPKSSTSASSFTSKRPLPSSSTAHNPATADSSHSPQVANQHPKHFVVPAHPQSHHLHTLPPREKTTRTLILDHTAWRQGRTRIAQGRCELGMNVRFKSEEQTSEVLGIGSPSIGNRAGFYIGTAKGSRSGPRRVSDFGDPLEVEIASSGDEGDSGSAKGSDGEGVRVLAYGRRHRQKGKQRKQEDDRMEVDDEDDASSGYDTDSEPFARKISGGPQDASLAPSLAVRATGIEKVLHAMLAQPPSSPPRSPSPPPYALHRSHANSQHYRPPPPAQHSISSLSADPARVLPNGLRLRLALLALVNDLFERQPPASQTSSSNSFDSSFLKPSITPTNANVSDPSSKQPASPPPLPPPSLPPPYTLPPGLVTLAQVSSQPFYAPPTLPSFHTLTLPSSSGAASAMSTLSPAHGGLSTTTSPGSPHSSSWTISASGKDLTAGGQSSNQTRRLLPPLFTWSRPSGGLSSPSSPLPLSPRSITPYDRDSERLSTISPTPQPLPRLHGPTSTIARQLPFSWKAVTPSNLPDRSTASGSSFGLVRRARGRSSELYSAGCYTNPSTTSTHASAPANSFRSNVPTFSSGTSSAPVPIPDYPLMKLKTLCPRHLREKCNICEPAVDIRNGPTTRIGAGLLKKQGSLLTVGVDPERLSGSVLADLIPRFLRLSALVAMELGREARGEEPEATEQQADDQSDALSPTSPISSTTRASSHFQPTRAWFALLCGLLTRAVLEGYVARSWKGSEYVEVLMGVGLGIKGIGTRRSPAISRGPDTTTQEIPAIEETIDEFEPDEMPSLIDACKVLFNGLVQDAMDAKFKATRNAEEEYVAEMEGRMSEFLTVPHASPDLATHLTQLSDKYPAEPVERAALRFCEAVAKWRGKPELEMYKKLPARSSKSHSLTPAPLSLNALLASTPTPVPHRPPIHKYFRFPPPSSQKTLKRQRSIEGDDRELKKEKVETMDIAFDRTTAHDVAMQDTEWVGPYGV